MTDISKSGGYRINRNLTFDSHGPVTSNIATGIASNKLCGYIRCQLKALDTCHVCNDVLVALTSLIETHTTSPFEDIKQFISN